MLSAREYFSEDGVISKKLEFYEFRPEQLDMALAVEESIEANKVLVAEAGPGVGKSLAYLVPFISWAASSGRKVVVSTYTKALQNQLFVKDLPLLKETLGLDFNFALCLGSENYLCLRRADLLTKEDLFDKNTYGVQFDRVLEWLKTTETGILSDMDFIPEGRVWEKFRRESDFCLGKRCRHYDSCFFMAAKRDQAASSVLVANHALLFTALKGGNNVLPDFDGLVIDEAHTLEDVATGHFGLEFSSFGMGHLLGRLDELIKMCSLKNAHLEKGAHTAENLRKISGGLRLEAEKFFKKASFTLPRRDVTTEFLPENVPCDDIITSLGELRNALIASSEAFEGDEIAEFSGVYADRTAKMITAVTVIFRDRPEGYVFWAGVRETRSASSVSFNASPINVSSQMKENIFARIAPIVLTSATISASSRRGDFTFFKERLGLDDVLEIAVDSPYLYKERVLFYLPEKISDPALGKEAFKEDLTKHITEIYDVMGGRIFALFTSYEMLNTVAGKIAAERPDVYILKQGDMPRYVLLDVFKKNKTSMLFGTTTFWQGVDVPGSSLECVIVTRLPFGVPTDPVNSARMRAIREAGRNPFSEYQMPQALIMFKQGFGRLIRSHSDRGVFVVLDPRIRTKEYGKRFLDYIPQCRITESLDEVKDFFT